MDEPVTAYLCPRCGEPVADDSEYTEAREYVPAPGFGEDERDQGARAYGAVRRFHVGHFTERVGVTCYELVLPDESSEK
jgi:hypothetical protein